MYNMICSATHATPEVLLEARLQAQGLRLRLVSLQQLQLQLATLLSSLRDELCRQAHTHAGRNTKYM
jgi:hypothetical protein